jgi:hypothetical protein
MMKLAELDLLQDERTQGNANIGVMSANSCFTLRKRTLERQFHGHWLFTLIVD